MLRGQIHLKSQIGRRSTDEGDDCIVVSATGWPRGWTSRCEPPNLFLWVWQEIWEECALNFKAGGLIVFFIKGCRLAPEKKRWPAFISAQLQHSSWRSLCLPFPQNETVPGNLNPDRFLSYWLIIKNHITDHVGHPIAMGRGRRGREKAREQ